MRRITKGDEPSARARTPTHRFALPHPITHEDLCNQQLHQWHHKHPVSLTNENQHWPNGTVETHPVMFNLFSVLVINSHTTRRNRQRTAGDIQRCLYGPHHVSLGLHQPVQMGPERLVEQRKMVIQSLASFAEGTTLGRWDKPLSRFVVWCISAVFEVTARTSFSREDRPLVCPRGSKTLFLKCVCLWEREGGYWGERLLEVMYWYCSSSEDSTWLCVFPTAIPAGISVLLKQPRNNWAVNKRDAMKNKAEVMECLIKREWWIEKIKGNFLRKK